MNGGIMIKLALCCVGP